MASAVPSQQLEYVLVVIMKLLECRSVGHRGGSITCMLRTKVVSSFAKSAKVVLVLQDNPERRMWLLYAY